MKMREYLFSDSCDGALFDTRNPAWSKAAPLRAVFRRTFSHIKTCEQFKATLRAGAYAWPGGYQMFLICSDGAPLCFGCGRKELRNILPAIANKDGSGWRVTCCEINYEDTELRCEHCGDLIPAAYGD